MKSISTMNVRATNFVFALCLVFSSSVAFAAPDIKPGAPAGSCCRVDGKEGASYMHSSGVWACRYGSIAFTDAVRNGRFPVGLDARTMERERFALQVVYPTCPAGWTLSAKAGGDICTAPVAAPACPAGRQIARDADGFKDVCSFAFIAPATPAGEAPRASN